MLFEKYFAMCEGELADRLAGGHPRGNGQALAPGAKRSRMPSATPM
jgi:hypothetical protein